MKIGYFGQQNSFTRVEALKQRSLDATADFVMAELKLGLTFFKLANNFGNNTKHFFRGIENARKALATAEKYMRKLRMDRPVFDRMTALVERLNLS
jgi:hypothetical protein